MWNDILMCGPFAQSYILGTIGAWLFLALLGAALRYASRKIDECGFDYEEDDE